VDDDGLINRRRIEKNKTTHVKELKLCAYSATLQISVPIKSVHDLFGSNLQMSRREKSRKTFGNGLHPSLEQKIVDDKRNYACCGKKEKT